MRPAYSVILFTTTSGAGYGMLAILGLLLVLGTPPDRPWLLASSVVVALALATFGLVASTFHLGRPERAWRAFSQWRTSWLSREGVLALGVYGAAVPLTALLVMEKLGGLPVRIAGATTAVLALGTIFCTAMIYASLKTVPQWRHATVPISYLLLGLATGALILVALTLAGGADTVWLRWLALIILGAAWGAKECYWRGALGGHGTLTTAGAIGLSRLGAARLLDAPHTESNYLLHEMGYRVARRHAEKLRHIARLATFAVPAALVLALAIPELPAVLRITMAVLAAVSALLGSLTERWLFFAEARHTVSLYYGVEAV